MSSRQQEDRKPLKAKYGALFEAVTSELFNADPIGINFEDNTDEYDPEAGTIIPRLADARTIQDVEVIIHEEFCKWFGPEQAGPQEHYRALAGRIWDVWHAFQQRRG